MSYFNFQFIIRDLQRSVSSSFVSKFKVNKPKRDNIKQLIALLQRRNFMML